MIDPRISLAAQAPNLQSSLQLFQNTRNNIQNREMNQQQIDQNAALFPTQLQAAQNRNTLNEQTIAGNNQVMDDNRRMEYLKSVTAFDPVLRPLLESGNQLGALDALQQRKQQLIAQGRPTETTDDAINQLMNGNVDVVLGGLDMAQAEYQQATGQQNRQFAPEVSPLQTDPDTGQSYVVETDRNTGQSRRVDVEGAKQRTSSQKREAELKQAIATETAKGKVARTNKMKAEFGERNRGAARARIATAEALKLVANADQGIFGATKLQLSKLLPGIDPSNEAALDSALNRLALEQLQKFKGPTTDYEFNVTQSIVGKISDSKEANNARLKSLERNNWFQQRESQQFDSFIENGGDPDKFDFNFDEKMTLGGAQYSLKQLQDTAVHYTLSIEEVMEQINDSNN